MLLSKSFFFSFSALIFILSECHPSCCRKRIACTAWSNISKRRIKIPENKPQVYSILVCTHLRGKEILVLSVWSGSFHVSQLSLWWCHMAGFSQFTIKQNKTTKHNNFYFMLSWNICFSSFPVNYGGKKSYFFTG